MNGHTMEKGAITRAFPVDVAGCRLLSVRSGNGLCPRFGQKFDSLVRSHAALICVLRVKRENLKQFQSTFVGPLILLTSIDQQFQQCSLTMPSLTCQGRS